LFAYRLHSPDGDDLGEATYTQMIYVDAQRRRSGSATTKFRALFASSAGLTKGGGAASVAPPLKKWRWLLPSSRTPFRPDLAFIASK
jgi:hypothetical protein